MAYSTSTLPSIINLLYRIILLFFFFFQAEDGIRDLTVTGVQTCALPISPNECSYIIKPFRKIFKQKLHLARSIPNAILENRLIYNFRDFYEVQMQSKRSEEHTSELQSQSNLVCRLLLEKKKKKQTVHFVL